MERKLKSIHLFSRPSFLRGFARLIDLGGTLNKYNYSESPEAADYYAVWSDWLAVGDDLKQGFNEYSRKNNLRSNEG